MLKSPMHTRDYAKMLSAGNINNDAAFFSKNCAGCHVTSCTDCHSSSTAPHTIQKPDTETCLRCHTESFTGLDYTGYAPRQSHSRYQRGETVAGVRAMTLTPDVHYEAGMTCGTCHSMGSLAENSDGKSCTACHTPSRSVLSHSIPEHLDRMECSACHGAWSFLEYGTAFIRFTGNSKEKQEQFAPLPQTSAEYRKSAVFTEYTRPPLGVNAKGKFSALRPRFILIGTWVENNAVKGVENHLYSARWQAFSPHTIRRETVLCTGCHENRKQLMALSADEDIFTLATQGIPLASFWNGQGQSVSNGRFLSNGEVERLMHKSPRYKQDTVKTWQQLMR